MSPIEQYTIDCEYLAYFEPKTIYKRDIMQLFSEDASIFLKYFFGTKYLQTTSESTINWAHF